MGVKNGIEIRVAEVTTPVLLSNFLDASMGIKKRETIRDASKEKTTAKERSPKIWPAIPSTKTIGKNTAIVVKVEAVTAPATSDVPFRAES